MKVGAEVGCGSREPCPENGEEPVAGVESSAETPNETKKADAIGILKGKGP